MSGKKSVVIGVHGCYSAEMTRALLSVFRAAGIRVESHSAVSVCVSVDEGDIAGFASGSPSKEAAPVDYLTAYRASIQQSTQPPLDAVALAALVIGSECHDKGSPIMTVARRVLADAGVLPHSGGKLADQKVAIDVVITGLGKVHD